MKRLSFRASKRSIYFWRKNLSIEICLLCLLYLCAVWKSLAVCVKCIVLRWPFAHTLTRITQLRAHTHTRVAHHCHRLLFPCIPVAWLWVRSEIIWHFHSMLLFLFQCNPTNLLRNPIIIFQWIQQGASNWDREGIVIFLSFSKQCNNKN